MTTKKPTMPNPFFDAIQAPPPAAQPQAATVAVPTKTQWNAVQPEANAIDAAGPYVVPEPAKKPRPKSTQVYLHPQQLDYLRRIEVAGILTGAEAAAAKSNVMRFALDRLAASLSPEQLLQVLRS